MIERLLDALFEREEINGRGRVETYLTRWVLLRIGPGRGRALYLHRFTGSDWSRHLHDHPKSFLSIGLWGSYVETVRAVSGSVSGRVWGTEDTVWRAPWVRWFPATHTHRLRLVSRVCWTLVYVGPVERNWGFRLYGWDPHGIPEVAAAESPDDPGWIPWDSYTFSDIPERLDAVRGERE